MIENNPIISIYDTNFPCIVNVHRISAGNELENKSNMIKINIIRNEVRTRNLRA